MNQAKTRREPCRDERRRACQNIRPEEHGTKHRWLGTKAEYLKAWSQPGALTGGLNYYRASQIGPPVGGTGPVGDPELLKLAPINVPTLVIWGEKDTALLTGNLTGLEAYVSQLTVRRISEGTHWVVHEYPDLINKYLHEFLLR